MKLRIFGMVLALVAISGCSITAPAYSPTVKSTESLKGLSAPAMVVKDVTAADKKLNKVSLRGNTLVSPYGDYSGYLAEALRTELKAAGLWSDNSPMQLSAVLTKNDIDAAVSQGAGTVSAKFKLNKDGNTVYEKEHSISHTWESSFVGAIAIPNAANAYPELVSKLVIALFSDPEFKAAAAK